MERLIYTMGRPIFRVPNQTSGSLVLCPRFPVQHSTAGGPCMEEGSESARRRALCCCSLFCFVHFRTRGASDMMEGTTTHFWTFLLESFFVLVELICFIRNMCIWILFPFRHIFMSAFCLCVMIWEYIELQAFVPLMLFLCCCATLLSFTAIFKLFWETVWSQAANCRFWTVYRRNKESN